MKMRLDAAAGCSGKASLNHTLMMGRRGRECQTFHERSIKTVPSDIVVRSQSLILPWPTCAKDGAPKGTKAKRREEEGE
ncbi:hypothetical protein DI44_07500 [Geobacillus sp. CAMR5420]|nr:hypothetical protein DI44_07500 [Geobacillus sp. CAMR5420]